MEIVPDFRVFSKTRENFKIYKRFTLVLLCLIGITIRQLVSIFKNGIRQYGSMELILAILPVVGINFTNNNITAFYLL